MLLYLFYLAITAFVALSASASASVSVDPSKHLVVLIHGLLGTERDLEYLGLGLRERDYVVLACKSNGGLRSFDGIRAGAQRVLEEIFEIEKLHPNLTHVSFVGLSLGGLYARYAAYLMSTHFSTRPEVSDAYLHSGRASSLSLRPGLFLCIASPFLGVRDHSYIEDRMKHYLGREGEQSPSVPLAAKRLIAALLAQTGAEVFLLDGTFNTPMHTHSRGSDSDSDSASGNGENVNVTESLLYAMATSPQFLAPLRLFSRRRLYANLDHDFMVNPSTGAFLGERVLRALRQNYVYNAWRDSASGAADDTGDQLHSEGEPCVFFDSSSSLPRNIVAACNSSAAHRDAYANKPSEYEDPYGHMRRELDSLGWEKFLVLFPPRFPYAPLAHNQLPALRKFPDILFSRVLGCSEGEGVMDHALDFMRGMETRADQTCVEGK
jgi:hypothetical protein